jgi:6-phosphogluconolactonase
MNETSIVVFADRPELVDSAATQIAQRLAQLLSSQRETHMVITGGTVGTEVLQALRESTKGIDLSSLHIWWIDERFVPDTSDDRNELQARRAWLDSSKLSPANIHPFPSSDEASIDSAAKLFAQHIEQIRPTFDLVLLGMGEDGHVASLFPDSSPSTIGDWVVIEESSPKPPAERLSLSMRAINSAKEILFLVSGSDKAEAVKQVLSGESDLPAALVQAQEKTTWLIDSQAASKITSS